MKLLVISAFALPALFYAAVSTAHPAPYYHTHTPPARTVVVTSPPPVVVAPAPVVVAPAPQVVEQPDIEYSPLSIALRGTALGTEGYKIHLSDLENPAMGGIGLQFRSRFDEHWGIELAADFLMGSTEDYSQFQLPLTLSLLFHLFPESRIQPYVLAGGGIQFTELEYLGGAYTHSLTELVGQIGLGVDVGITRRLNVTADLRFLGMYKNLGETYEIAADCHSVLGAKSALCNDGGELDRFNAGLQFTAGLGYKF